MTLDPLVAVRDSLVQSAGGYLRNLRLGPETCSRCFTPYAAGELCPDCTAESMLPDLPEVIGFVTYASYARPIGQSGQLMRGYKQIYATTEMQTTVALIAANALKGHMNCVAKLVGTPVAAWATVPSLPHKPGRHKMNEIVGRLARTGSDEIGLRAADAALAPRSINRDHYSVTSGDPRGKHVMIVDDTWTGGGHAQSAVLAMRAGGASVVSVLCLARWLTDGWQDTSEDWLRKHLTRPDFDAAICPWTQAGCP